MVGGRRRGRVRKIPAGMPIDPTFGDILKARPREAQAFVAGAYWQMHPRSRSALRWAMLLCVLGAVFYVADRYGLFGLALSYPFYTAIVGTIAAVVAILSYLGKRAKFRAFIPPDDPGHFNLPYLPDELKPGPGFGLTYLPLQSLPGTYPLGRQDAFGRRWAIEWIPPSGDASIPRALQFKFASVIVQALRNDAIGCRAEAKIFLRTGRGGSVSPGEWNAIGRLNWYLGGWDEQIIKGEVNKAGFLTNEIPNLIADSPTLGLNEYLSNPEVTIHEGRATVLPLFYMREGWPGVYLCGPKRGMIAGDASEAEPVTFEIEVTVSSLKSRPLTFGVVCTAKWDKLTVDPAD